ncbi:MAG TPA: acetyltransferase [Pasteurellaceae bacterium]|nr:acetyltransferase [Pasteurellaceae bacterium]
MTPTPQQAQIIDEILQRQADIYIVTAKRGRGKSALAGLLAKALDSALSAIGRLSCKQRERIILTAPNKSAVGILQDFAQNELNFMAPDELFLRIQQTPEYFRHDWLLIDEAAMIPLDLLDCLTSAFKHVLCTTTIHSYEGTGRGFLLKFMANIDRTFRYFELHKPLRWAEDDLPERFIDDLLLLDCEDRLAQPAYALDAAVNIMPVSQSALINSGKIADFYGLLTLAHYRTTPLDLRRLFDAPRQQFWLAQSDHRLIGCVWALEEGGLQDFALITDICRGIRRPKGNLVAQSLAFQSNLPQACELKSLRISRIAVQPNWQHHRIGVRLIDEIVNTTETDFLSVSFGYTEVLVRFWQKCGFNLVHLGEYKEATSGCYSAIALRPISPAGMKLAEKAAWHFRRNIGLSFHPLADQFEFEPDWRLTDEDWAILQNFSNFNRTLSSSLAAIRRLLAISDTQECPLLMSYCTKQPNINMESGGKKSWLTQCRLEIQQLLQKHEIDSNIKHGLK